MGAQDFRHTITAATAQEAFAQLCADAAHESGYRDGYGGDIHTKSTFRLMHPPLLAPDDVEAYIDRVLDRADKWDTAAYAIDVGPVTVYTHTPAPATRCTVIRPDKPSKPPHWVTQYVIEPTLPTSAFEYFTKAEAVPPIRETRPTQTAAIARAKALALQHQIPFHITRIRVLEPAVEPIRVQPIIPPVPSKGRPVTHHRWCFFGLAPS